LALVSTVGAVLAGTLLPETRPDLALRARAARRVDRIAQSIGKID
jgi:hypothetical protein